MSIVEPDPPTSMTVLGNGVEKYSRLSDSKQIVSSMTDDLETPAPVSLLQPVNPLSV